MTRQKLVFPLTFLVITLFLQMLATPGWSQSRQGQANTKNNSNSTVRVSFEPPNGDRPRDTAGGASRDGGRCPQDPKNVQPYITAILPTNSYGLTVASHPTFFVYLPPTAAQKAFFSIRDESDRDHYQTFLPLQQKSGVMAIQLPADAPPLEMGKTYKWSFAIACDSSLRPDSPLVEGQIQRVEMNSALNNQLEKATALEKAALYGKAGIWYETLSILSDLRRNQPENADIAANWADLLKSVELDAIATQPLIK
jgi:hypothetical protein